MKYISEYRDKNLVKDLIRKIEEVSSKEISLMEVCGGHTMAIHKHGISQLLPKNITLLSGPGCPVCVTEIGYIDYAVALCRIPNVIIATFGDLIRVPGSSSGLELEKAEGADIRIVFSSLDAVNIAISNKDKTVVFLGIGFETTAPGTAAAIVYAKSLGIGNFKVLSAHKIMPPAMRALIDENTRINGYICPGHVSVITGSGIYEGIVKDFGLGCVISGFEPADMLLAIYMLAKQIEEGKPSVEIAYKRAVRPEGNQKAVKLMEQVFELKDDVWRGFGVIPDSGLKLREGYRDFEAEGCFELYIEKSVYPKGCICGAILKGLKKPVDCKLFGTECTPENPAGACMVSNEGACRAYYRYGSEYE